MIRIGLAVESMKHHTTSEGWEIFAGLEAAGYKLCGFNLPEPECDVAKILSKYNPDIVVIQDPREWDVFHRDFREPRARFINYHLLKTHPCMKVGILKDAHQRNNYHKDFASAIGYDVTIIYYDEEEVRKQAPYVGRIIRTYHSVDKDLVPTSSCRDGIALLSGAISPAYPLRRRLRDEISQLPKGTDYLPHPGYHRNGCHTPEYLKLLSRYRIAICTSSMYNYTLRRMIEATAAGCVVLTNLPQRYSLPAIEDNLIRITDDMSTKDIGEVIKVLSHSYNEEKQYYLSCLAKQYYDYRVVCSRLAEDIDTLYNEIKAPTK